MLLFYFKYNKIEINSKKKVKVIQLSLLNNIISGFFFKIKTLLLFTKLLN